MNTQILGYLGIALAIWSALRVLPRPHGNGRSAICAVADRGAGVRALMSALARRALLAGKDVTRPFVLDGVRYVPIKVPKPT